MKPGTGFFIERVRECLADAIRLHTLVPRIAGRKAYLAAFHATQALIYERTSRVTKTHRGVRAPFSRLAQDEPKLDHSMVLFLARGYEMKARADYGTGPEANIFPMTPEAAITGAARFIEVVEEVLA